MQPDNSPPSGGAWVRNDFPRPLRPRKSAPQKVTASLSTESRPADSSELSDKSQD